jgi:hypothetical protein
MSIPEQDGWIYKGFYYDGLSFVCSTYVSSMWKAAGVFGDIKINAAE